MKSSLSKSFRDPPKPPKFLVVTEADSSASIVKLEKSDSSLHLSEAKDRSKASGGLLLQSSRGALKNSRTDVKGSGPALDKASSMYTIHKSDTYLGAKPRGAPIAPPKSLERASDRSFAHEPILNTTTSANSSIQFNDHTLPIGPENPVIDLNEVWSAYWDDAAGAVYYYNHDTREATWIYPDIK